MRHAATDSVTPRVPGVTAPGPKCVTRVTRCSDIPTTCAAALRSAATAASEWLSIDRVGAAVGSEGPVDQSMHSPRATRSGRQVTEATCQLPRRRRGGLVLVLDAGATARSEPSSPASRKKKVGTDVEIGGGPFVE